MNTTENNLEQNIKKALRKAKTLLKGHSWDWWADIGVYDNDMVTSITLFSMRINAFFLRLINVSGCKSSILRINQ